jgi:hypothetical protein
MDARHLTPGIFFLSADRDSICGPRTWTRTSSLFFLQSFFSFSAITAGKCRFDHRRKMPVDP